MNEKPNAPLSDEDIAELAELIDLLARFDYEDKQAEGKPHDH